MLKCVIWKQNLVAFRARGLVLRNLKPRRMREKQRVANFKQAYCHLLHYFSCTENEWAKSRNPVI